LACRTNKDYIENKTLVHGTDHDYKKGTKFRIRGTNHDYGGNSLGHGVTRVNSTNVLDEGLRIGEIGRRINSKVNSVKQGGYESKRGCRTWLAFNLSHTIPSWPLYIDGQVSRIG
jgi:hypothetical protein